MYGKKWHSRFFIFKDYLNNLLPLYLCDPKMRKNQKTPLWQHEMSPLCFIFVLFWLNLVHCGKRWVGGCGAAARRDGVTGFLCVDQFCSCNTGCVCVPALRIQQTPRHCLGKREQEQSTVYSSLLRVCTALLSLSGAGSCGWYIPDNEWEQG